VNDGSTAAARETVANFGRNVVFQPQTMLRPWSEDALPRLNDVMPCVGSATPSAADASTKIDNSP